MYVRNYNLKAPLNYYYHNVDCFGRTKVCFLTDDLKVVSEKVSKGWSFTKVPNGFFLEAPEIWLVDIAEPAKVAFFTNNPAINYAYFLWLKDKRPEELIALLKSVSKHNKEFYVSEGKALETEVRVILDDKLEAESLMNDVYATFLRDNQFKKYLSKSKKEIGSPRMLNVQRNKRLSDYPVKIVEFFQELREYYSLINIEKKCLYNYDYIADLADQTEAIFGQADHFVFVPWGCFKYIGNFLTENIIEKVMLWETHMLDYNDHQHRFRKFDLNSKDIVIFDKSYTGGTLDKIADLVRKENGNPVKVALFPKSREAVMRSDYIVFLDRIIKSSEVDISSSDWYKKLYRQILTN